MSCLKEGRIIQLILTKCLATSLYVIHRCSLGFETCDGPIASLTKSFGNYILIEVCCQPNSALSQEAKKKGMSYVGINDNMEQASVFRKVETFIREFGHPKVFVHVSSPCASGSPLRYLKGSKPTDADFEWFAMFPFRSIWRWVIIPVLNCHGEIRYGNTI